METKTNTANNRASAKTIELTELANERPGEKAAFANPMDLIKGVKVTLSALVGRAELTVSELFALKEGGVIALDRDTREPVDIYLGGKLVGRAELVVVGDNFGLRIVEIGNTGS